MFRLCPIFQLLSASLVAKWSLLLVLKSCSWKFSVLVNFLLRKNLGFCKWSSFLLLFGLNRTNKCHALALVLAIRLRFVGIEVVGCVLPSSLPASPYHIISAPDKNKVFWASFDKTAADIKKSGGPWKSASSRSRARLKSFFGRFSRSRIARWQRGRNLPIHGHKRWCAFSQMSTQHCYKIILSLKNTKLRLERAGPINCIFYTILWDVFFFPCSLWSGAGVRPADTLRPLLYDRGTLPCEGKSWDHFG